MLPGQTSVPEGSRSHPNLCRRRASVAAPPSRCLASPASPAVPLGRRRRRTPRRGHRPRRHRRAPPVGDARATWTPHRRAAALRTVRIGVGWGAAIAGRRVLPTVALGDSGMAAPVRGRCWRPRAPLCRASVSHPICWGGRWARWPQGWAAARSPACARAPPTPSWPGGWRRLTISRPSRRLSSTLYGAHRSHWTSSPPCSGPSRRVTAARPRRARAWHAPRPGGGERSPPCPSCGWPSTSAIAPWRWRHPCSIRGARGGPLAVCPSS